MRSIPAAIMEFELIDSEEPGLFFRLFELTSTIGSVDVLEPLFVDILDGILAETGDLGNLLVCISTSGKQIASVLVKGFRNKMPGCLE